MEVTQYREDERAESIIAAVLKEADNALQVDCADQRVAYTVLGWFLFPKGSLLKADLSGPS